MQSLHIATITSKRQITLPAKLYRKLGWMRGMKMIVEATAERWPRIIISPADSATKEGAAVKP